MSALTNQVDCLSVTIEVGGMPVRVLTAEPEFVDMLQKRYAGFLNSAEKSDIEFEVEILRGDFEEPEADVQVTRDGKRWMLTRGDFEAVWEPEKRRCRILQKPNPFAIDSVLRIVHSLLQANSGGFLFHAASAIRNRRAFLFAGESGAGKTTISGLAPPDATLLTDEISYVRKQDNGYAAYGTPFTGELARLGENVSAPVAALYILDKGSENRIEPIEPAVAVRCLLANVLFFAKDEQLVQALFHSAFEFVKRVPVSKLTFVPTARVWELII